MKSGIDDSILPLPKGGGALQGISQHLQVNKQKGSLSLTIPIALPAGRRELTPDLSLIYSSTSGNSSFGLGWALSLSFITRKTDKGIPRYYDDGNPNERDTFVLSNADDLVLIKEERITSSHRIQHYKTKTEANYFEISRIINGALDYWVVTASDGTKHYLGYSDESRPLEEKAASTIFNSEQPSQVFKWLLTETEDTYGNVIIYHYTRDEGQGIARKPYEKHHAYNQSYLTKISYVNYDDGGEEHFLYSVNFDYGIGSDDNKGKNYRPDPFSTYKAGFEIRTARRCQSIQAMLQEKQGDGTFEEKIIKTYQFNYVSDESHSRKNIFNQVSLLETIEIEIDGENDEVPPPIEFSYAPFTLADRHYESIHFTQNASPEGSLATPNFSFVDIFGNSLPCIMHTNRGHYRYWRNEGGEFTSPLSFDVSPPHMLNDPGVSFADMLGNGSVDLLVSQGHHTGFYELQFDTTWKQWHSYSQLPSFNLESANVRMFDITGNGIIDTCLSTPEAFVFFTNHGKAGWSAPFSKTKLHDLDHFPNVNFGDYQNRTRLADMSGDGMQDIVVINRHQIDYWPNLGYGRFGKRISMRIEPVLPDHLDPNRVILADIDGDGCADLIYIEPHSVTVYANAQGNHFRHSETIPGTPPALLEHVQIADLKGHGMPGLVWSYDVGSLNMFSGANYKFLDLTHGRKPYLLTQINNHMGVETNIIYKPSTWFYLRDRKQGLHWQTHLPFPVHCVARVETLEYFSRNKLTQEYFYHHGHWDGVEREFCGFGRVDQRDSESFYDYNCLDPLGDRPAFDCVDEEMFSPPVETRAWFHLGAITDQEDRLQILDCRYEYWAEDPYTEYPLKNINGSIDRYLPKEKRLALRALRGSLLRSELYALDQDKNPFLAARPYRIEDSVFEVVRLNLHTEEDISIYTKHHCLTREAIWERGDTPMIRYHLLSEYNEYGQPQREISIAIPKTRALNYSRHHDVGTEAYLATYTELHYIHRNDGVKYLINLLEKKTVYEIKNTEQLSLEEVSESISVERNRVIIEQSLQYYDVNGNQNDAANLQHGVLRRQDELVLTARVLEQAYATEGNEIPPYLALERDAETRRAVDYPDSFSSLETGYFLADIDDSRKGRYRIKEKNDYDNNKGLLVKTSNGLGHETQIEYDAPYQFLPEKITLPNGLETHVSYDYRVGKPESIVEPNGNETFYRFTALGLLKSIARLDHAAVQAGDSKEFPGTLYNYNFRSFYNASRESRQPIYVYTLSRKQHIHVLPLSEERASDVFAEVVTYPERYSHSVEYTDGLARLLQNRKQASRRIYGDDALLNSAVLPDDVTKNIPINEDLDRCVVSGWMQYNNKGLVVKQHEPFFDSGLDYQHVEEEKQEQLQYLTQYYDPLGRIVRVQHPNHSEQSTWHARRPSGDDLYAQLHHPENFIPSPWEYYIYDPDDNAKRMVPPRDDEHHQPQFDTPSHIELDALGRISQVSECTRNDAGEVSYRVTAQNTHDMRNNLIKVEDAKVKYGLRRAAFQYTYDLVDNPLRIRSIDAGTQWLVHDANSNVIEKRETKGSLLLNKYDVLDRLKQIWARDHETPSNALPTLRVIHLYGDTTDEIVNPRQHNLLGQLYRTYDETGIITFGTYDFKGNNLTNERQVVDDASLKLSTNLMNGEITLSAEHYTLSYIYDALDRFTSLQCDIAPISQTFTLTYTYDEGEQLAGIQENGKDIVKDIAYNPKEQRVLIRYGNDLITRYSYELDTFWLKQQRTEWLDKLLSDDTKLVPASRVPQDAMQDTHYEYDLVGNITATVEQRKEAGALAASSLRKTFRYDLLYQLAEATGREITLLSSRDDLLKEPWQSKRRGSDPAQTIPYREKYGYDEVNSLEELEHTLDSGSSFKRKFTFFANTNRVETLTVEKNATPLSTVPHAYEYDESGNLTQEGSTRKFQWNYANHLHSSETETKKAVYLYNVNGLRVKKQVRESDGSFVSSTVYINELLERSLTSAGAHTLFHIKDGVRRIATLKKQDGSSDELTYHISDHLNSTTVTVDDTGHERREEYTPYGETSFGGSQNNSYRFSGKEADDDSNLYYYGARYYAPWLCRWMSPDPSFFRLTRARNAQQRKKYFLETNLFAFSEHNPIIFFDPNGEQSTVFHDLQYHLRSAEALIDHWVTSETVPTSQWDKAFGINPESALHNKRVEFVINYALIKGSISVADARNDFTRRALEEARNTVTLIREEATNPRSSLSIILRDAERYLWGRAGISFFAKEFNVPRGLISAGAPAVHGFYDVIKRSSILINFEARSNIDKPMSAAGGYRWFSLGREQYWQFDENNVAKPNLSSLPRLLNQDLKLDTYGNYVTDFEYNTHLRHLSND